MAKIILSAVVCLAMFGSMAVAAGPCLEANGTYPVSGSCDAYIECRNGVPEEKLCPDGLLFNGRTSGYPCGYPIEVQCDQPQARSQPPQSTDECPRQFGYYRMGDSKNCGQFKNCASGRGYILDCPDGLAWNPATYRCDWPDQVEDCDAEAFLGFKCPALPARSPLLGEPEEEYTFYPSPNNCQQYYLCIEGRPRRISCGEDQAFNEELKQCDDIENVPNCSPEIKQRGIEIKNARLSAAAARKAGHK
ncbi:protein obstructor-E-like [Musca vetustissima]|uniref:protein obstructor-E-like n=1 Tax=Musca vetustissima TaxID=27455 RepID=UPI002AB7D7C6|nr:protein obstructor-E-like [Musca vetustissima]